jgi:predicted RNA binding protein YcfA (HicA-like mRNA interferase family)
LADLEIKYRDVVQLIEDDGWHQVRQKGSHRAYKHNTKAGIVTIAYHRLADEVPKGTLNSIFKQAGFK